MPPRKTQDVLRQTFTRWGRPRRVRVDNGTPWGPGGDLPTPLALWLCGLAIELVANPPRRPEENGVVERSQGTGQRWAEPGACVSPQALQARLRAEDRVLRELYPRRSDGQTRAQAYPGLAHSGRAYSRAWEAAHWSLAAVEAWLSTIVVPRRLDGQGKVSVYGRKRFVGRRWGRALVWVGYDPESHAWTFSDEEGRLLQKQSATEITRARIMALDLGNGET